MNLSGFIFKSIILICLLQADNLLAQQSKSEDYIIMFVREDTQKKYSTISITYANGKIENIPLNNSLYANLEENNLTIVKTINAISNKGYELVGVSGGEYRSRYIFKKNEL